MVIDQKTHTLKAIQKEEDIYYGYSCNYTGSFKTKEELEQFLSSEDRQLDGCSVSETLNEVKEEMEWNIEGENIELWSMV